MKYWQPRKQNGKEQQVAPKEGGVLVEACRYGD